MNKVLKYISESSAVSYEEFSNQVVAMSCDGYPGALAESFDLVNRKIIAKDPTLGVVFRVCEMQLVVWENKLWSRCLADPPNTLHRGHQQSYTSKSEDRTYIHPAQYFIAKHKDKLYRVQQEGKQLVSSCGQTFLPEEISAVVQYDV